MGSASELGYGQTGMIRLQDLVVLEKSNKKIRVSLCANKREAECALHLTL